mgnify:CR=1 FL=1
MKMSLAEIAKAIRVQNDIAKWQDLEVTNVAFDSRALEAGALFIPLMGEQDGHKYVANAFENWRSGIALGPVTTICRQLISHCWWLMIRCRHCRN